MEETIGYQATKKMEDLLYNDSGIYKCRQFKKASVVTLKSAMPEMQTYWDEEIKFRPFFDIDNDRVKMPVFFAKINGCSDTKSNGKYFNDLRNLLTDNSILFVKNYKYRKKIFTNFTLKTSGVIYQHLVNINRIKACSCYRYASMRPEIQDFILEKVKFIIEKYLIKGTFTRGTEYLILTIALNLSKKVTHLIHNFDFTKLNPKIIFFLREANQLTIEDSIFLVLMHYLGFDVIVYDPTGYNCFNKYLNAELIQEYQDGDFCENIVLPKIL